MSYVGSGIIAGAGAGFAAGTVIPGVGNFMGAGYGALYGAIHAATFGGWLLGTTGYILSVTIYMNDQQVCVLNYKACIQRKNGN